MPNYYLEFEEPIKKIDEQITSIQSQPEDGEGYLTTLAELKLKRDNLINKIYSSLSRWE
mgnify:FL=1